MTGLLKNYLYEIISQESFFSPLSYSNIIIFYLKYVDLQLHLRTQTSPFWLLSLYIYKWLLIGNKPSLTVKRKNLTNNSSSSWINYRNSSHGHIGTPPYKCNSPIGEGKNGTTYNLCPVDYNCRLINLTRSIWKLSAPIPHSKQGRIWNEILIFKVWSIFQVFFFFSRQNRMHSLVFSRTNLI